MNTFDIITSKLPALNPPEHGITLSVRDDTIYITHDCLESKYSYLGFIKTTSKALLVSIVKYVRNIGIPHTTVFESNVDPITVLNHIVHTLITNYGYKHDKLGALIQLIALTQPPIKTNSGEQNELQFT